MMEESKDPKCFPYLIFSPKEESTHKISQQRNYSHQLNKEKFTELIDLMLKNGCAALFKGCLLL